MFTTVNVGLIIVPQPEWELPRGKVESCRQRGRRRCRNALTGPDLKAGPAKKEGSNVKAVRRVRRTLQRKPWLGHAILSRDCQSGNPRSVTLGQ